MQPSQSLKYFLTTSLHPFSCLHAFNLMSLNINCSKCQTYYLRWHILPGHAKPNLFNVTGDSLRDTPCTSCAYLKACLSVPCIRGMYLCFAVCILCPPASACPLIVSRTSKEALSLKVKRLTITLCHRWLVTYKS